MIVKAAEIPSAIQFEGVSVYYEGNSVLESIWAQVPLGGCTCIVGPNGAGKTTLIMAILQQIAYIGQIRINLEERESAPRIGYVPQRLYFDRGMPLTVEEFLCLGIQRAPVFLGIRKSARKSAGELLESVHAYHLARRRMGALSGGELQRVLLALALIQQPEILVLDEPAAGLDFQGEHLFCELLDKMRIERGFTQVMVTHDLGLVNHHATHAILLNRKLIAEGEPKVILNPQNLAKAFGIHMGGAHFH
jgi:zinc transport system ATP-binding protein